MTNADAMKILTYFSSKAVKCGLSLFFPSSISLSLAIINVAFPSLNVTSNLTRPCPGVKRRKKLFKYFLVLIKVLLLLWCILGNWINNCHDFNFWSLDIKLLRWNNIEYQLIIDICHGLIKMSFYLIFKPFNVNIQSLIYIQNEWLNKTN